MRVAASTIVNNMTVVHMNSGGLVTFAPDVCMTPCGSSTVPIPYVNIAKSQDTANGSGSVACDGNPVMVEGSCFSQSTGDEPGSAGGVVSGVTRGKAEFINFSFDVMFDGKCVARQGDTMLGNKGGAFNTPPAPEVQPPAVVVSASGTVGDIQRQLDHVVVQLLDVDGKPVANARVLIKTPDGEKINKQTSAAGEVRVDNIVSGLCEVSFPNEKHELVKKAVETSTK